MHAASVIAVIWAMMGAACLFPQAGGVVGAAMLAVLVAVVGLPHGAADHRFARARLEPRCGSTWPVVFLSGYLATAAIVVLGWFMAPGATMVIFFLASAWHFGQEEPRLWSDPVHLRPLFRFARGGLVMWVPIAFQADEVLRMLSLVAPRGLGMEGQRAFGVLVACSWIMLTIAAAGWGLQALSAIASTGRRRRTLLLDSAMVASLCVLLATMNPLVGFVVYFCAWHSVRGFDRLRRELGETWPQVVCSVAPLTAASIAMIALTAYAALRSPALEDTLIRATFVGLSAVAVPHVLLHGVAPLLQPRGQAVRRLPVGSSA